MFKYIIDKVELEFESIGKETESNLFVNDHV